MLSSISYCCDFVWSSCCVYTLGGGAGGNCVTATTSEDEKEMDSRSDLGRGFAWFLHRRVDGEWWSWCFVLSLPG